MSKGWIRGGVLAVVSVLVALGVAGGNSWELTPAGNSWELTSAGNSWELTSAGNSWELTSAGNSWELTSGVSPGGSVE